MAISRKKVLLLLVLVLLVFSIAYQGLRRSSSGQLQAEGDDNIPAERAEEIDSGVKSKDVGQDSIEQSTPAVIPKIINTKRKLTWEKTLKDINSELSVCDDWFDTVKVLSAWLYQNTRVGDIGKYNINRVIPKHYVVLDLDLQYLYELNNSDSVVGDCGFHGYYASLLYKFYGIKSYCFSMRPNPKQKNSAEGHLFNILENPHNKKWYPVDNYFGIRYRYDGEWLDMEKYFQLSGEQLCKVSIETFGTFKFYIQDSPYWDIKNMQVVSVETGNYPNHFRLAAPYTLKHQFPHFKAMFDPIAATYNQPPHLDWLDLARRMPLYGARIFPLSDLQEQLYADTLLSSWNQHPQEFQNCPPQGDAR